MMMNSILKCHSHEFVAVPPQQHKNTAKRSFTHIRSNESRNEVSREGAIRHMYDYKESPQVSVTC